MKYGARLLTIVTLGLCASMTLWSQARSTDNNRLFTLPPGAPPSAATLQLRAQHERDSNSLTPVPTATQPIILNFDNLPGSDWTVVDCNGGGSGSVAHGILTINSPSDCYEYDLFPPHGTWNQLVSNSRGWIIETNLIVDPITQPECDDRGALQIWANDYTILVIVGFSTNEICLAYPDHVDFPMNTTDSYHIYRVEAQGMHIQIYVDGTLAIDHVLTQTGGGTQLLMFGDGTGQSTSLSRWDYFSYQVFP